MRATHTDTYCLRHSAVLDACRHTLSGSSSNTVAIGDGKARQVDLQGADRGGRAGALPTRTEWKEVVELCRDNGAYLFSDEMYRLLEEDPESRLPSAVDAYEKAITLSGTALISSLSSPVISPRRHVHVLADVITPGNRVSHPFSGLAGLSKAWGLPGLRLGWLATHDAALLQRVLELKDYTTM